MVTHVLFNLLSKFLMRHTKSLRSTGVTQLFIECKCESMLNVEKKLSGLGLIVLKAENS